MSKKKEKGLCRACLQAEIDIEVLEQRLAAAEALDRDYQEVRDRLDAANARLAAAEAELENARDAARLIFEKATFIGNVKEYLRFPGWQKIAEMYTWLAQQEDEAAKGGRDEPA